jgi:hypothetical protein
MLNNNRAILTVDPQEEERKRRMAWGKAQGLDDATIQKYELIRKVQEQQRVAQTKAAQQPQQQPSKQPSTLKKFGVNTAALLGSAAAGVGAVAAAPFTGGVSLAGGVAAGAGIEALRRRALGEKQSLGASALEGGLTLLPGVAKGIKLLTKGAKTAKAAEEVVGGAKSIMPEKETLKNALIQSVKTPEEGGRLTRAGDKIRANQRGILPGEKLVNSIKEKPLNSQQATDINKTIDQANKGFKPNNVRGQLVNVQNEKDKAGKAITTAAQASKATVKKDTTKLITDTVDQGRSKILKFDPQNVSHAKLNNQYAQRLAEADTPDKLLAARRVFDKTAKATFDNPSIAQTVDKELAAVYRTAADKALAKIAPELKPMDREFALLSQAEKGLTNKTEKLNPSGFKPAGTAVNGKGFGGPTIQRVKEGTGKTLQTAGKVTANPITKAAVLQSVPRAVLKPALAPPQLPGTDGQLPENPSEVFPGTQDPNETALNQASAAGITDPQELLQSLDAAEYARDPTNPKFVGVDPSQFGYPADKTQEQTQSQYPLEQYMQDIQADLAATGGKNVDKLTKIYDTVNKSEAAAAKAKTAASGEGGLNITKTTAQQYGLAQSGASAVTKLKTLLQDDSGVLNRSATPGRTLPIVGGFVSNAAKTGDFDAIGYNIADTILRLRTGATANESEVKKLQSQIMPRAGDSPQTIQTKLTQIDEIFSNVINLAKKPSTGTDLSDISQLFNQPQGDY